MGLHANMMSRAFLAISHLKRSNREQADVITQLTARLGAKAAKRGRSRRVEADEQSLRKQLEQSLHRVSVQDETIRSLNGRIEQLIAENVLAKSQAKKTLTEEEGLLLQSDSLRAQIRAQKLAEELESTRDELFNIKHKLLMVDAQRDFLETQNSTLLELLDVEKAKVDAATRDYLNRLNQLNLPSEDAARIRDLQKDILVLKREKEEIREGLQDEMMRRLAQTRKEFEMREMEIKKRAIAQSVGGSHQAVLEALQKQHEQELAQQKQNIEDEISVIRRSNAQVIRKMETDFDNKLKSLQQQMTTMLTNKSTEEAISLLQKQFDDRELELRTQYAAKVEMIRSEAARAQKKLEDQIIMREQEIEKLVNLVGNTEVQDSTRNSPTPDNDPVELSDEISEKLKGQVAQAVSQFSQKIEAKFQRRLDGQKNDWDNERRQWEDEKRAFDDERQNWDERIRQVGLDIEQKAQQIEQLNSEVAALKAENAVFRGGLSRAAEDEDAEVQRAKILEEEERRLDAQERPDPRDVSDLFIKQSEELRELQDKLAETQGELNEYQRMRRIEQPIEPFHHKLSLSDLHCQVVPDVIVNLVRTIPTASFTCAKSTDPRGKPTNMLCLSHERCISFLVTSSRSSLLTIACQTESKDKPFVRLASEAPLEIFAVQGLEVKPEVPIVLAPSPPLQIPKPRPVQLLTKTGELVSIPPLAEVTPKTHPAAAAAVAQSIIGEARDLSAQLHCVVGAIQAIEQEPDPRKRAELQKTLGVALDIERDSVVSDLRGRITELEQLAKALEGGQQRRLSLANEVAFAAAEPSGRFVPAEAGSNPRTIASQGGYRQGRAGEAVQAIVVGRAGAAAQRGGGPGAESLPGGIGQVAEGAVAVVGESGRRAAGQLTPGRIEQPGAVQGGSTAGPRWAPGSDGQGPGMGQQGYDAGGGQRPSNAVGPEFSDGYGGSRSEGGSGMGQGSQDSEAAAPRRSREASGTGQRGQEWDGSGPGRTAAGARWGEDSHGPVPGRSGQDSLTPGQVGLGQLPSGPDSYIPGQSAGGAVPPFPHPDGSDQPGAPSLTRQPLSRPSDTHQSDAPSLFAAQPGESPDSNAPGQRSPSAAMESDPTSTVSASGQRQMIFVPSSSVAPESLEYPARPGQDQQLPSGSSDRFSSQSTRPTSDGPIRLGTASGQQGPSRVSVGSDAFELNIAGGTRVSVGSDAPPLGVRVSEATSPNFGVSSSSFQVPGTSSLTLHISEATSPDIGVSDSTSPSLRVSEGTSPSLHVSDSTSPSLSSIRPLGPLRSSDPVASESSHPPSCTFASQRPVFVDDPPSVSPSLAGPVLLDVAQGDSFGMRPQSKPSLSLHSTPPMNIETHVRRVAVDSHLLPHATRLITADVSDLKQSLLALQGASPEQTAALVADLQARLDALRSVPEPAIIIETPVPVRCEVVAQTQLKRAIEATRVLTERLVQNQSTVAGTQTDLVDHMNRATHSFVESMDKAGGATPSEQSSFLGKVNSLATHFEKSVAELQSELAHTTDLRNALDAAQTELAKQAELVQHLQDENIRLRTFADAPRITTQFKQVQTELQNLIEGHVDGNRILTDFSEASKIIQNLANQTPSPTAKTLARAVGQGTPDWRSVATMVDDLTSSLSSETAKRRSEALVRELNSKNQQLLDENDKLQTQNIIANRDLSVLRAKADSDLEQLHKSLDVALGQNSVLERQLNEKMNLANATHKELKDQLLSAQLAERDNLHEIQQLSKENEELRRNRDELQQHVATLQERYQQLFSEASDTQTAKQQLEAKTAEILRRSEIDQMRLRATESLNTELNSQLDKLAQQLQDAIDENLALERRLAEAEDRLNITELNNLKEQNPPDVPRLLRLYQQKADLLQQQLQQKASDLLNWKGRHATDAKAMVQLQRELDRCRADLRLQVVRFESSRAEVRSLQATVGDREATIRLLRHEIERLRQGLAMQVPLTQNVRLVARQQNDTVERIVRAKREISRVKQTQAEFGGIVGVNKYCHGLLQRQEDALRRLEQKRKQFREIEEANRIAALRALEHVVRMEELAIPEPVVLKMMPKPQPVRNLQRKVVRVEELDRDRPVYDPSSYAGTLQRIGDLAGKAPPEDMHEMLRLARRNVLVDPPSKKERPPPQNVP
jgi:hypothetical protein